MKPGLSLVAPPIVLHTPPLASSFTSYKMSRESTSRRTRSFSRRKSLFATALLLSAQAPVAEAIVYPSSHELFKFDYLQPRPESAPINGASKRKVSKRENPIPLIVTNNCGDTIWPGVATQAGDGPESSGFELGPGETRDMTVGPTWNGRVWGRTNCTVSNETATCMTGDCFGLLECEYSVSCTTCTNCLAIY